MKDGVPKGVDDLIMHPDYGFESFMKGFKNAKPFDPVAVRAQLARMEAEAKPKRSKRKDNGEKPEKPLELPRTSITSQQFAEDRRDTYAFNQDDGHWYIYESEIPGVWSLAEDSVMRQHLRIWLDAHPENEKGFDSAYLGSFMRLAETHLLRRFQPKKGLIPMRNGVFDKDQKKLISHAPGNDFTWALTFDYNPVVSVDPILEVLLEILGDRSRVELFQAYLYAVINKMYKFQRSLLLTGVAGAGKSVLVKIMTASVGFRNCQSVDLRSLENNNFTSATLYGKLLAIFPECETYSGPMSVFKALTGGDPIRLEEKGKQAKSFVFDGMTVLVGNSRLQTGDYSGGLQRRLISMSFNKKIPAQKRRDLIDLDCDGTPTGELVPHLPGLFNWIMSISEERVAQLLRHTEQHVPSLIEDQLNSLIEGNNVAQWLDEYCVFDPSAKTYVGASDPDDKFKNSEFWLFTSYLKAMSSYNQNGLSQRRFTPALLDLCQSQLGAQVSKGRDEKGSYFAGIAIRDPQFHRSYPNPISGALTVPDGSQQDPDGSLTVESTETDGSDGSDGLNQISYLEKTENPQEDLNSHLAATAVFHSQQSVSEKNPSEPSEPSAASIPTVSEPSAEPSGTVSEVVFFGDGAKPTADELIDDATSTEDFTPKKGDRVLALHMNQWLECEIASDSPRGGLWKVSINGGRVWREVKPLT